MKESEDWFDNYIEPVIEQKIDLTGWYSKDEINNWEFYEIDKDDILNDRIYIDISDIYPIASQLMTKFVKTDFENLYVSRELRDPSGESWHYMYDFGDKKVLFYVYESNNIYKKKNVITLTGWDYNILIDLDDKTIETKYVR